MLRLEANESKNSNQKALWTQTAASRETTGNCISGLSLASVKDNIHTFHKLGLPQVNLNVDDNHRVNHPLLFLIVVKKKNRSKEED